MGNDVKTNDGNLILEEDKADYIKERINLLSDDDLNELNCYVDKLISQYTL